MRAIDTDIIIISKIRAVTLFQKPAGLLTLIKNSPSRIALNVFFQQTALYFNKGKQVPLFSIRTLYFKR